MAADITAIILTKNEEVNIEECIKSIIATVKRIVVIDRILFFTMIYSVYISMACNMPLIHLERHRGCLFKVDDLP